MFLCHIDLCLCTFCHLYCGIFLMQKATVSTSHISIITVAVILLISGIIMELISRLSLILIIYSSAIWHILRNFSSTEASKLGISYYLNHTFDLLLSVHFDNSAVTFFALGVMLVNPIVSIPILQNAS